MSLLNCFFFVWVGGGGEQNRKRDTDEGQERSLMVLWVIGSILNGGPIELFLVPASAPRLV